MRKRITQYTNFSAAMSSLKEFASARKKEPCPANTSPCSVSQLSRSSVETPVKEQSVHTDIKPFAEHTPLPDNRRNQTGEVTLEQSVLCATPFQCSDARPSVDPSNAHGNLAGGFTLEHSDNCATPLQRIDTKPSVKSIQQGNAQGNLGDGFTLEHSNHSTTPLQCVKPSAKHRSPSNMQENQASGFTPSSHLIQSAVSDVSSKGLSFNAERVASKLDKFKRKTDANVEGNERKFFNGMTLVLDFKPVNGENFVTVKSNELKVDGKMESRESDCALKKPESEALAREQLSSPVLFSTPQTSPSLSPVNQDLNSPGEGKERTSLNSSNLNLGAEKPSAFKRVGNGEGNLVNNSITLSKKGSDFGTSSLLENTGGQGFVPVKKLFKLREADTSSSDHGEHGDQFNPEKKPRDILDDVNENLSHGKAGLEDGVQATVPNVVRNAESKQNAKEGALNLLSSSKRSKRACNSVSEMPSNVRLGQRKSTRLRRFSNSSRSTKEEEKEVFEVRVSRFQSGSPTFIGITKLAPTQIKVLLLVLLVIISNQKLFQNFTIATKII